jgi:CrcB protein
VNLSLLLFVGVGGFFGAISRFLLSNFVNKSLNSYEFVIPFGTLAVNVLGSFIIGFMAVYFEENVNPEYKALVITGFLGALTTFSTFSLENIIMIQDKEYFHAGLNIVLNVVLTLTATIMAINLFKRVYG